VHQRLLHDVEAIPRFAPTHILVGEGKRLSFSVEKYFEVKARLRGQRVGLWNRHTWEEYCSVIGAGSGVPNTVHLESTSVRAGDDELLGTFLSLLDRWRPDFATLWVDVGVLDARRGDPALQRSVDAFRSPGDVSYYLGLGPLKPWTYLGPVIIACVPPEALVALGAQPCGEGVLIKSVEDPTRATPLELTRARYDSALILRKFGVLAGSNGQEQLYGPNWKRPATWTGRNAAFEKWMRPYA
jgi:hypothetical protein